ncbi:MAG: type secretion system protein, partial [Pseudomonadota bacterium]
FDCPQGDLLLRCEEDILATPNPAFRRVQVTVVDTAGRKVLTLSQVVPNAI